MRRCGIIELTTKLFFRTPIKERFYDEAEIKITRIEAKKQLEQLNLACELPKLIRHLFPDLLTLLKQLPDPRHQSYIAYPAVVLLMTRILSSVFSISSMRKTFRFLTDLSLGKKNIAEFEEPLLSDPDRPYDSTDTESVKETVERHSTKPGTETLQDTGSL